MINPVFTLLLKIKHLFDKVSFNKTSTIQTFGQSAGDKHSLYSSRTRADTKAPPFMLECRSEACFHSFERSEQQQQHRQIPGPRSCRLKPVVVFSSETSNRRPDPSRPSLPKHEKWQRGPLFCSGNCAIAVSSRISSEGQIRVTIVRVLAASAFACEVHFTC